MLKDVYNKKKNQNPIFFNIEIYLLNIIQYIICL